MGIIALVALVPIYFRIIRPLRQLRLAIRRLAERDYRPSLLTPSAGIFRETAGQVQKISELLKQLDQQVADEGFSLRAILSSMVEGVLIADRNQRVRLANDSLYRLFELKSSPINRTIMEVFRNHELQQAVEKTLRDGQPRQIAISFPVRHASGQPEKHFEIYAGGLNPQPSGGSQGVVVVIHDVTAIRNLEAVRREFVANVSHEFRTPLAIINGYIETLLDGALDDRPMAERALNVMQQNGQRLTLLIEDLMTISRMEARSVQLDFQPASLRALLQRVLERLEPAIAERKARIEVTWPAEAENAEVDTRRVEQVFSNLLENAFRYGFSEEMVLRVSARVVGGSIEIGFHDNGPGIPYEDQPHIFERFYRVHKDRSRVAGGTGLGLSIVKNIVLAHGGEVALESVPGRGATFLVRFPRDQNVATPLLNL